MRLKYAYGIVPENSGGGQEALCRDKVGFFEKKGVTVIYLSEPTGRKDNPVFCGETTVEALTAFVAEQFDELNDSDDDSVMESIQGKLEEALPESGNDGAGMDWTLQFVAVKDDRFIAGHLGGGLIARSSPGCSVLSAPSAEGHEGLRIYRGDLREPFGFMLMNAGAGLSLYESDKDSLSPACGTFFEWLQEHDEEMVSEALADNIRKYFFKYTGGDIVIALIVSDQDDTLLNSDKADTLLNSDQDDTLLASGQSDDAPGVQKSIGMQGKRRNTLKFLIVVLFLLAAIYAVSLKQSDVAEKEGDQRTEDPKPPVSYTENNYEPSVSFSVKNPQAFEPGEYKAGVDIPAGEYFFWTGEMLKPNSIFVNDETCLSGKLYCLTVRLNQWDTLVTEYRFTSAENVNPVKPTEGVLLSGKYKIGKDIAPGTYQVSPADRDNEGRYYSLLDEKISNDIKFKDDTTVEVPEEGYIVFYNSVLIVEAE